MAGKAKSRANRQTIKGTSELQGKKKADEVIKNKKLPPRKPMAKPKTSRAGK